MFKEILPRNRYGYVLSNSKYASDLESQQKQLIEKAKIPPKNIKVEILSPSIINEKPIIFQKLIEEELSPGTLLVVTHIDSCSGSGLQFLKLQEKLFRKNVTLICLNLPYSADLTTNKLIAHNLALISEFDKNCRRKKQRIGIQAAKKAGRYPGRKTVITQKFINEVQYLKDNQKLSVTEISKITGRARSTIYKVLKQHLNYVPYNRLIKHE